MGKTNTPEELKRLQGEQEILAKKYFDLTQTDVMAALKLRPQVSELANKIERLQKKLNGSPPPGPVVAVAESPVAPVKTPTSTITNARQAFANEQRRQQEIRELQQQEYYKQEQLLQQKKREEIGKAQLLQQQLALEEEMDGFNKARLGPPKGGQTIGFANAVLASRYGGGKRKNRKTKQQRTCNRRSRHKRTRRYRKN